MTGDREDWSCGGCAGAAGQTLPWPSQEHPSSFSYGYSTVIPSTSIEYSGFICWLYILVNRAFGW